jgi:sugar lactone lactonase YvrE
MNQPLPAGPFQVRGVTLVNSQGPPDRYIPEVVLPALGGLTGLESIGTDRPAWTEADLARLTETPNVRSVTKLLLLVELTPTAVGLAQRFPRLHDVAFTASAADDALLAQLPKAFPRLVGLKLKRLGESGRVTVRGYAALAAMPLGYLELNQAQGFDREAAARLATMPHLTSLFLTGTPVSPEVTAELARCPTLWELRLAETGLTDAGLSPLAALKSLKRLDLSHTRVTEAGRRKLAQALPQVKIVTDGKPGAPEPPADPDPSPFDRLRREAIPPAKLQAAGNPPPEVVAILGESQGQKSPAHLHLAVHPQGTVVALGGDIYRQPPVVLWDPITGEERPFGGPKGVVTGLHLDPTGTWLATASAGAGLWNLATGAPGRRLSDRPYRTWASVAFTPDGRWVAYANRGIVVRQDQDPPALFRVDDPNAPPVPPEGAADAQMDALAMSPDGQFLAGSGHPADLQGNWVKLWAVPDGKLVRVLNPDLADRTLAFSPDGRRLFTTRYRLPEVFVYDVATGQGLAPFRGHTRLHDRPALVSDAAVSPDGRRVASCDWNGAVVVWDPETLQQEQVIRLNPPTSGDVTGSVGGGVHKVYWAPDGRHLVTKNADGTAYVVRLNPGPP